MNDANNEIDMKVTRKEFVDAFKQDELDRLRAGRLVDEYNKGFNSAWELMDKRLRHVHSSNVPWAPYEQWLRSIDASIAALSDLPYEVPSFDERSSEADKEKS